MIGKIKAFTSDVVKEMKKVSWPTREQLKESTIVVLITTGIFTLFTFLADWIFTNVVKLIF